MAQKRLKCKTCSNTLSSWGKTSNGKKRYFCKRCGKSRNFRLKTSSEPVLFKLFKHYVLWGLTYEVLAATSGYSVAHLIEKFHRYLLQDPPDDFKIDQSQLNTAYLLIDGLWFGRWFVLMVYRQSKNLTILRISSMGKEVSTKISKDLQVIKSKYRFTGIVSDGATGIKKAVLTVFGHIPHQICLAHMHRDVINAIGRYPKDKRVKKLKKLADHVWLIESREALQWWRKEVIKWARINEEFLNEYRREEHGSWWFIHKGVRKAVRTLLLISEVSFAFLDHPLMPKTTNEIEAQFGHLGKRWLAHRGLKRERWITFLNWFVYFYNQDKLASSFFKTDYKNHTKS